MVRWWVLVYCGPLALLTSLAPVWRMQACETRRALLPYVGAAAAAASLALRRARGCRGAAGSLGAAAILSVHHLPRIIISFNSLCANLQSLCLWVRERESVCVSSLGVCVRVFVFFCLQ